jgi:diaminopimelate decarboxylase
MRPSFFISGTHSGSNPSPGLGTALSLRLAFPDARLVGVDYSSASTGLHHPVFDDIVVNASWEHIDLEAHSRFVAASVHAPGSLWFSGLDVEAAWLAGESLGRRVLVCPASTFAAIEKPAGTVAEALGLSLPDSTTIGGPREPDFSFIDQHGWPVWVKGRRYEAFAAYGWRELDAAIEALESAWGPGAVVQQHVDGPEESIAFAARSGELVGAVAMRKLATTVDGKTWAGETRAVPDGDRTRLAAFVAVAGWHGGGEIEMVHRSSDGERFLIDVNPRFPAWIHGGTRQGAANLPAALVNPSASLPVRSGRFVRVVTEIPSRRELAMQIPAGPVRRQPGASGKHPSGMPILSRRLADKRHRPAPSVVEDATAAALSELAARADQTPFAATDLPAVATTLGQIAEQAASVGLTAAYSIKTNPDRDVLELARAAGWLAEAISGHEVNAALAAGWQADQIVLNGPAKAWPATDTRMPYLAVFYDSLAEFDAAQDGYPNARAVGVRVRPLEARSRFGVDVAQGAALHGVARRLRAVQADQQLALHLHIASSAAGLTTWLSQVAGTVRIARAILHLVNRPVQLFDLGGGFTPTGLDDLLSTHAGKLVDLIRGQLGDVEQVVFEPGKSVVAPHGYVVSRVLFTSASNMFVDASIAELPDGLSLARPLWLCRDQTWLRLPTGLGRVFGRSCIEDDVVARGVDCTAARAGDLIVFGNAGAYDTSMRFSFASAGREVVSA